MDGREFHELIPYEACPVCNCVDMQVARREDCSKYPHYRPPLSSTMVWMSCIACGHSFRNGFYTDEAFSLLTQAIHPSQQVGYDYERQRLLWARAIEKVIRHQASGLWVDVGFGNGALLMTAAEYGFQPIGLDLREENVRRLRDIGIRAEQMDITRARINPEASVISFCDVLEHMRYPRDGLAAARRNLCHGGVLLLSLPAMGSPLWNIMDSAGSNPYWREMEHFHNFSRPSLEKLLTDHGFSPVSYGVSERYRACMEIIAIRR